ncbi:hypothetical protein ZN88_15495 [Salmonella enterica subsp. enterica serovar Newport]|nr:hypothetical protein [Salmonella enterica subsp. enterica serovar Newport]
MNEQWEKVLSSLITKVTTGADAVIQFGSEQLPEILKQLLIWNFTYSLLIWVLSLSVIVGYLLWMGIKWKWWMHNKATTSVSTDNSYSIITFIWSILAFISLIMFFSNLDWLKIWVAPKLYLLEYAASLIKGTP